MRDTFLYVLVLYKVHMFESVAFTSIVAARPEGRLFVYDNSPTPMGESSGDGRIVYYHDTANEGISKAYIAAAHYAREQAIGRLGFFDQDTSLTPEFFTVLELQIKKLPEIAVFAPILRCGRVVVSPAKVFLHKGIEEKNPQPGVLPLVGVSLINSTLCVSTEAYFRCGGYNRAIRLDFSDIYFVDQLRKHYTHYCLLPIELTHSLSTFMDAKQSVVSRFRFYCDGAREYLNAKNFFFVSLYTTLRMLKLCVKYKTVIFANIYFQYFIIKGHL